MALREDILTWLKAHVPEPRIRHILRVEEFAIALAKRHQLDPDPAAQAGLMHDLAKFFPPEKLLAMAEAEGLVIDPVERADPHLLHATVSAIVARDQFGIQDQEILAAIRHHTMGAAGMSLLSCVIYLADSLEPGRGTTPELEELRQLSRQNLETATWRSADYTLNHLVANRRLIHPQTVITRNFFLEKELHY